MKFSKRALGLTISAVMIFTVVAQSNVFASIAGTIPLVLRVSQRSRHQSTKTHQQKWASAGIPANNPSTAM